MSDLFLSIIIPAYNEELRLPGTLEQVLSFCSAKEYSSEILVVENGSSDRTRQIAQEFAEKYSNLSVYHESQRGKGRAVQRGILEARGEYRFMCDADLSMPIEELERFLPPELEHFDIAIASREAPGAVRYEEPNYRHIGGRAINSLVRTFALPDLQDTQCGFKCFRALVAEDLFGKLTMTGWSFDIEMLYIARLRDYRIVEIPIPWHFNPESKVNVVRDALKMIRDIFVIRRNASHGSYDPIVE